RGWYLVRVAWVTASPIPCGRGLWVLCSGQANQLSATRLYIGSWMGRLELGIGSRRARIAGPGMVATSAALPPSGPASRKSPAGSGTSTMLSPAWRSAWRLGVAAAVVRDGDDARILRMSAKRSSRKGRARQADRAVTPQACGNFSGLLMKGQTNAEIAHTIQ